MSVKRSSGSIDRPTRISEAIGRAPRSLVCDSGPVAKDDQVGLHDRVYIVVRFLGFGNEDIEGG
jgi:hypothetical protein